MAGASMMCVERRELIFARPFFLFGTAICLWFLPSSVVSRKGTLIISMQARCQPHERQY